MKPLVPIALIMLFTYLAPISGCVYNSPGAHIESRVKANISIAPPIEQITPDQPAH